MRLVFGMVFGHVFGYLNLVRPYRNIVVYCSCKCTTLLGHGSVPALVILYTIWDLLVISASASAGTYIGTEGEYPDTGLS